MHVPAGATFSSVSRSGRRRWITVSSTLLPCGSSSKETSPLPCQVKASLRGGSSSVIRLCIRCSSGKPAGRSAGRVGKLVVAPDELEGRADLHLHLRPPPATGGAARSRSDRPRRARSGRAAGAGSSRWRARSARHRRPTVASSVIDRLLCGGGGCGASVLAEEPFEHIQTVGPEALVEAQPFAGRWRAGRARAGTDGCARAPRAGSARRFPAP